MYSLYTRGFQPVAHGPKEARQAAKSGPRPFKESKEKIYEKLQKLVFHVIYRPTEIIITTCYSKLYYFDIYK